MLIALFVAIALVVLPAEYVLERRQARKRRGVLFADCLALFETYRVTQSVVNFPILEGTYKGLRVRLEPVLDDMGVRKLPSLWLKVTLLLADPDRGMIDFLVRPQGNEVYSPCNDLPCRHEIPNGWPRHAILCTDESERLPDLTVLTPHIRAFDNPRMKELLITPRGVRLVYQAAQATRAEYLVLRQARFERARIDPGLVRGLLDSVIAIAADIDAATDRPKALAA